MNSKFDLIETACPLAASSHVHLNNKMVSIWIKKILYYSAKFSLARKLRIFITKGTLLFRFLDPWIYIFCVRRLIKTATTGTRRPGTLPWRRRAARAGLPPPQPLLAEVPVTLAAASDSSKESTKAQQKKAASLGCPLRSSSRCSCPRRTSCTP